MVSAHDSGSRGADSSPIGNNWLCSLTRQIFGYRRLPKSRPGGVEMLLVAS